MRISWKPRTPDCAAKLAVLGDPTRLAVVQVLMRGPRHVKDINRRVRVAQNLLSHHLRILREAGLVASSRDGKAVTYALAPGVDIDSLDRSISLGCCRLTFSASPRSVDVTRRPRTRRRGRDAA